MRIMSSSNGTPVMRDSTRNTYPCIFARVLGVALSLALALATVAMAQERFPSSTVAIVVPFPPGGATDYVARSVGNVLAEAWKVPVVVENRVGAAGNIAADFVARAPANGQTIMLGAASMVVNPPLYKIAPYIPRQLVPIGIGVTSYLVTIGRSDLAVKDMAALLALPATRQGQLNGASAGTGTLSHLGLEMLAAAQKIKLNHIPYKGSAPAVVDVMGGRVDVMIDTIASAAPAINSGKVKALGVHTEKRVAALPGAPTYDEQGLRGMNFSTWNIFVVPAATPPERIAALHAAFSKAIQEPAIAKSIADRGMDLVLQTPKESLEFMAGEAARWEAVVRERNLSAN